MPRERNEIFITGLSGPIENKKHRKHFEQSLGILTYGGLRVVCGSHVLENRNGFSAGTVEQRLEDFEKGLEFPSIGLIAGGWSITELGRNIVDLAIKCRDANSLVGGYSNNEMLMHVIGQGLWGPHIGMLDTWNRRTQSQVIRGFSKREFDGVDKNDGIEYTGRRQIKKGKLICGGVRTLVDTIASGANVLKEPVIWVTDTNEDYLSDFYNDLNILSMRSDFDMIKAVIFGRSPEWKNDEFTDQFPNFHRSRQARNLLKMIFTQHDIPVANWPGVGHAHSRTDFFVLAYGKQVSLSLAESGCTMVYT